MAAADDRRPPNSWGTAVGVSRTYGMLSVSGTADAADAARQTAWVAPFWPAVPTELGTLLPRARPKASQNDGPPALF